MTDRRAHRAAPWRGRTLPCALALIALLSGGCDPGETPAKRKVGVAFLIHGGFEGKSEWGLWESTLQIFSYDPNSFVYRNVIWNPDAWPRILGVGNAPKERGKYAFELERIGGFDPAMEYSRRQLAELARQLEANTGDANVEFVVDYVSWIGAIEHLAHPRSIYEPGTPDGALMTYCGSKSDGGLPPDYFWPDCDPERYDIDGTIDRMLKAGVDEIIVVDLTTSGVRFFKSFDVVRLSRTVIDAHNARNGTDVRLHWVNDPADLMTDSYPDAPEGWTISLGPPERDRVVPLAGRPNPVSSDPALALLQVEGIEAAFNPDVAIEDTGIMLINHATRRHNQFFDPKIDDTLEFNQNIRAALIDRNPGLSADNIVGSWMGRKRINPAIEPRPPGFSQLERTREMRGEDLGHAYLYESNEALPSGEWAYLYWDALDLLKDQGVRHIVIAFPQIMVDSVLNLVELPNQIAKEIGYRNWMSIEEPDFKTYPAVGHPFAEYWGIWVETQCPIATGADEMVPCCFEMGGCADGRPYPPPRLAPADRARNDLDPSLAYAVSEFGHLGYDPTHGAADPASPVQDQYRGTWALWQPPNDDPRVGQFLAEKVLAFVASRASGEASKPGPN